MSKWVSVHASNGDELLLNMNYVSGVCVKQKYYIDNINHIFKLLSEEDALNIEKAIKEQTNG